jgi:hypothetical protein
VGLRLGPVAPRVIGHRVVGERRELGQQLAPERSGERRGNPDVMQPSVIVVQAEQQRTDALTVLVDPVARHGALGGALVLDLHERPLVGRVRVGEALRDHAIEPGTLEGREPLGGLCRVGARRREVDRPSRSQVLHQQPVPLGERLGEQGPVTERQQIERHERRRGLGCEPLHPRRRWMDPLAQRVEVEAPPCHVGDDDLTVDDASLGQARPQRIEQLGEVAVERSLLAARELHVVAVSEHDAPETVPLRLEQPAVAGRDLTRQLRQHRGEWWRDGQDHAVILPDRIRPAHTVTGAGAAPRTRSGSRARGGS